MENGVVPVEKAARYREAVLRFAYNYFVLVADTDWPFSFTDEH